MAQCTLSDVCTIYCTPGNIGGLIKNSNVSLSQAYSGFLLRESKSANINPYPAKLINLNFQPLEVVSRYRDPQPQVVENYSYLFNLIYKFDLQILMFKQSFYSQ